MANIGFDESETIEFKLALSELNEAGEVVVSMANKSGGKNYFGIKNNGDIIGIGQVTDSTLRKVSQNFIDNINPQLILQITKVTIYGKECIEVVIPKSTTPHHTYKDIPYIRIGTTTKRMLQHEYQRRLIQYASVNPDFTAQLIESATFDDLHPKAIKELRKLLIQSGRYDVNIETLTDEQLLKKLLLMRDGKLTVAAIILLGNEDGISKHVPYSEVRYGYRNSESDITNIDTQIFKDGYFVYYNRLYDKIQVRNTTVNIPIGLRLVEKKAFDSRTIREAINNAITHRDYTKPGSVILLQYPQKITILNPGGLPEGVTIENIMDETRPRNKFLADILFKCELVEEFGTGVNLMFRNQVSLGMNPPNYSKTTDSSVDLELDGVIHDEEFAIYVIRVASEKNKILNDVELSILNKIRNGHDIEVNSIVNELEKLGLIEKTSYSKYMLTKQYFIDTDQKTDYTRTKGFGLTTQKELILQHIKQFGKAAKKDFAKLFEYKYTPDHIGNLIKSLKKENRITYIGKPKSALGFYCLPEDAHKYKANNT